MLNAVSRSNSALHLKKMESLHSKVKETSKSFHIRYNGEVQGNFQGSSLGMG